MLALFQQKREKACVRVQRGWLKEKRDIKRSQKQRRDEVTKSWLAERLLLHQKKKA